MDDDYELINITEQTFPFNNMEVELNESPEMEYEHPPLPSLSPIPILTPSINLNNNGQFTDQIITPNIEMYFNTHILPALLNKIHQADLICVMGAWFTDPIILQALMERDSYILVQFQPELNPSNPNFNTVWQDLLRHIGHTRLHIWSHNSLLHHKMMIFCRYDENSNVKPYAVWTGSANFTIQSRYNQENCVFIQQEELALNCYNNFWYLFEFNPD